MSKRFSVPGQAAATGGNGEVGEKGVEMEQLPSNGSVNGRATGNGVMGASTGVNEKRSGELKPPQRAAGGPGGGLVDRTPR